MSYAAIASHNIPEGHMPEPDQSLTDGHFKGEHEAHADVDHHINILPAGQDPHHPKIEHEEPAKPEPIVLHHAEIPEPHVSEAAPKPAPAPHKGEIHIPQSGEEFEKKQAELKKEAKKDVKKVEKEAGEVKDEVKEGVKGAEQKGVEKLDQAEKKGKEALGVAEEKGKEALGAAKEKGEELKQEAGKALDSAEKKGKKALDTAEKKGKELANKADAELQKAESALAPYWEKTKDVVLRPGTLGGLMGVVNVGILGTAGYFAYTRRDQPWDRRLVSGAVAGTLALFGAEGYVAESYLHTTEGRAEAERAKREGSRFWMQTKERVLRPNVAGGLVGALNLAVLSTVGYFSYQNWHRNWDPRVVSAVTVGLVGLSGIEGWAGKAYKDNELPKH